MKRAVAQAASATNILPEYHYDLTPKKSPVMREFPAGASRRIERGKAAALSKPRDHLGPLSETMIDLRNSSE